MFEVSFTAILLNCFRDCHHDTECLHLVVCLWEIPCVRCPRKHQGLCQLRCHEMGPLIPWKSNKPYAQSRNVMWLWIVCCIFCSWLLFVEQLLNCSLGFIGPKGFTEYQPLLQFLSFPDLQVSLFWTLALLIIIFYSFGVAACQKSGRLGQGGASRVSWIPHIPRS